MAICPRCSGRMDLMDKTCPLCGFDFPQVDHRLRALSTGWAYGRLANIALLVSLILAALGCVFGAFYAVCLPIIGLLSGKPTPFFVGITVGPLAFLSCFTWFVVLRRAQDFGTLAGGIGDDKPTKSWSGPDAPPSTRGRGNSAAPTLTMREVAERDKLAPSPIKRLLMDNRILPPEQDGDRLLVYRIEQPEELLKIFYRPDGSYLVVDFEEQVFVCPGIDGLIAELVRRDLPRS